MIHWVRYVLDLWVETKGTLESFREQERMIIDLLELFSKSALIPAENNWPFENLRGESDPSAAIVAAAVNNDLFLTEFFESTLQRMLGNCRLPGNPAETSRLTINSVKAKIQNGLVFGQENRVVWSVAVGRSMRSFHR